MFFVNLLISPYTSKKDSQHDFVGRGSTPPLQGQTFPSEMLGWGLLPPAEFTTDLEHTLICHVQISTSHGFSCCALIWGGNTSK